jgi:hypothetical protein
MKEGRLETFLKAAQHLPQWQKDPAFAVLREPRELARLPEEEKRACQQLWADFPRVLQQAERRVPETRLNTRLLAPEPSRVHRVALKAGTTYLLDLESTEFDAVLKLEDAAGKILARGYRTDLDSLNARIVYTPAADGTYRLVVNTRWVGDIGAYTLRLREVTK